MAWKGNAVQSDLQVTAGTALRYEYKHNSVNLKLLGKIEISASAGKTKLRLHQNILVRNIFASLSFFLITGLKGQ